MQISLKVIFQKKERLWCAFWCVQGKERGIASESESWVESRSYRALQTTCGFYHDGNEKLLELLLLFNHQVMSDSLATPWTIARQAPLSMGLPRQEYWHRLPFPSPGDLLDPGIKSVSPGSPPLVGRFFTTEPPGSPAGEINPRWKAALCQLQQAFPLILSAGSLP